MPVQVFVAEVRSGRIVPDGSLPLPEGLRVTVVAEVPEKGLVAVDPEDAELIQALNEAEREERGSVFARWSPPIRPC
jgi:hypothetical protein